MVSSSLDVKYSLCCFAVAAQTILAFAPTQQMATIITTRNSFSSSPVILTSTAEPPEKVAKLEQLQQSEPLQLPDGDNSSAWECNDDATECVVVDACDEERCRTTLDVRIHGNWYDLSGWRKAHPAGVHWIDWYDGRDATEVMDGFHSEKGRQMYKRLPLSKENTAKMLEASIPEDSKTQIAFRKLRQQLEEKGYWKRDFKHEGLQLGLWASFVLGAAATASTLPIVSTSLLAISFTAAGWLGHDYIHGVDGFSNRLRNFAAVAAGLAPTFWSDKHNKHHALTNEQGVDEDIATSPFLYTWAPNPQDDSPLRKVQHLIFWLPFSMLFALWRVDSIKGTWKDFKQNRKDAKAELKALAAHYLIMCSVFPWQVWLPAVFVSGLVSALIVTPTHQDEAMFEDYQPDFVTAQFMSTRNAVTTNPFSEWIWGGMQYQLEHHLFPTMPRNRYPQLRETLIKFAKDNNVPGGYRETNEWLIMWRNWLLYRKVAKADAVPGAPLTRGRQGQIASIVSEGLTATAA